MTTSENMEIFGASRKKPKSGDIFVLRMKGHDQFIFGRVIRTDAKIMAMEGCILIYIYRAFSDSEDKTPQLKNEELLVPPMMTNQLPWSKGYFKVVKHIQLTQDQVLPTHCFHDFRNSYFDEYNNKLVRRTEPCGEHALKSYRTIDDAVSKALGVPLAAGS